MDTHVKHRIIGVVVLATLVALLVPLCFTGTKKGVGKERMLVNIPNPPSRPVIYKTADLQKLYAEKQKQMTATPNIQSINQRPVEQQEVTAEKNGYWVIQLASFADHANADKLMKELIYKGFVAHVQIEKTDQSYMYHVFVGPKMSREKAESLLERLQKTFPLKGLITKSNI
jgi:cell division septation protein DedD